MPGNTIGILFRLTTFGESHSHASGGIIDGCPPGLDVDLDFVKQELERRKPSYKGSTSRKEDDLVELLSGVAQGRTLGTPIGFLIKNKDVDPSDYQTIEQLFRPSHADYSYFLKYGQRFSGGGRASGRETAARVVGGAVAKLLLRKHGTGISAVAESVGGYPYSEENFSELVLEASKTGDTLGGTISCRITNAPAGLGEPVFDKLQADLAKAMMSIGTAKGFEYGLGFKASTLKGSAYNDQMTVIEKEKVFLTNHDGGIQGGISNGEEIYFRVAFKPVPSVKISQKTFDTSGNPAEIRITGRHDICHIPRLVVVVESMAAIILADHHLRDKACRDR